MSAQTEIISKALRQVDGIFDSAKQVALKDRQFADEISSRLNLMSSGAGNANPQEAGYEQVNRQTETVVNQISTRLRETVEEAVKMGAGQMANRTEIENLLHQAKVDEAKYKLSRITNELQRQRELNQARRFIVKRASEENEQQARMMFHRLPENARKQIEGGLLHRFAQSSQKLAEEITSQSQHLSTIDRNFIAHIQGYESDFGETVNQLLTD